MLTPDFWTAARLMRFREMAGLTQNKLAEYTGASVRSVKRWEAIANPADRSEFYQSSRPRGTATRCLTDLAMAKLSHEQVAELVQ